MSLARMSPNALRNFYLTNVKNTVIRATEIVIGAI